MKNIYIKPEDRKTILFIGDDLRCYSGVGVMSRSIVYRTATHFNWIQIGCLRRNQQDIMKRVDISSEVNDEMGYKDSNVIIYQETYRNGDYGCIENVRWILQNHKIDAILIFTDPHYYEWLFKFEKEIREQIPIIYLNIWDNLPYPLWNKSFYESCDGLLAISKQTYNINYQILKDRLDEKIIKYVPHGIENTYFPMNPNSSELIEFKNNVIGGDSNFILLFNARNMGRKNVADLIFAWQMFTNNLTLDDAQKCKLVIHCNPVDNSGTDLIRCYKDNCDPIRTKVLFVDKQFNFHDMNLLYNSCDGVILPSYAEGWGLSITESMMTGRMFIATVTGGMQDQMRFEDNEGNWISFSQDFPSNSIGKYKKHGEWCIPIWPSATHVAGSVKTPYIYDEHIKIEDICDAINQLYKLNAEERNRRGKVGYEWANSDEAGFTARMMAERVVEGIEDTMSLFKPHNKLKIYKVEKDNECTINRNIIWKLWKSN